MKISRTDALASEMFAKTAPYALPKPAGPRRETHFVTDRQARYLLSLAVEDRQTAWSGTVGHKYQIVEGTLFDEDGPYATYELVLVDGYRPAIVAITYKAREADRAITEHFARVEQEKKDAAQAMLDKINALMASGVSMQDAAQQVFTAQ